MAVAFDAKSTAAITGGAATSIASQAGNITVGSGSNRVLICCVQFGAVVTSPTVSWDSGGTPQSMYLIGSATESDNLSQAYLFGLVAPHSGALNFSASWTGSASWTVEIASYTSGDQTGTTTTFKNTNSVTGTSADIAITINSPSGDMAVASFASNNALFNGAFTGTEIAHSNTNVTGIGIYTAGTGASTSLAVNTSGGFPMVGFGCDIAAAGAADTLMAQVMM